MAEITNEREWKCISASFKYTILNNYAVLYPDLQRQKSKENINYLYAMVELKK